MRMTRLPSTIVALLLAPELAFAHAHLREAAPTEDAALKTAPAEISLSFTEALEPSLSGITAVDANGRRVDDGHIRSPAARQLTVGLKPLAPGTYTVTWSVTSVDTHRSMGHYSFTVAS